MESRSEWPLAHGPHCRSRGATRKWRSLQWPCITRSLPLSHLPALSGCRTRPWHVCQPIAIADLNNRCVFVGPSSLTTYPLPRVRLPSDQELMRVHMPARTETLGSSLKELLEVCFHYPSGALTVSGG